MTTATVDRIRRCNRESEFAISQDLGLLASRPDAKPAGQDDFTIDSFFDATTHAQAMLTERFAFVSSIRASEAAETSDPLLIGVDVSIAPKLPFARMVDATRSFDRVMLIKGLAVDLHTDKNSIEAVG